MTDEFVSRAVAGFFTELDALAQVQPVLFAAGSIELLESPMSSRNAGTVRVGTLWAFFPGAGWGGALVRIFAALADRSGVSLDLEPVPLVEKDAGPDMVGRLRRFYAGIGFVDGEDGLMVRRPDPGCRLEDMLAGAFAGERVWAPPQDIEGAAPRGP